MNISEWGADKLKIEHDLLKNFVALCLIQATNFIIPLITFPYLIRVIGIEKFGVISYGLTILTFILTFVDYGFNLSGTRLVSIHRNNTAILSELFTKVMGTKLVLMVFSLLIMGLLYITISQVHQEVQTYLLGIFYIMGNVLMPTWFFQGIEQMKYITYANILAKVLQVCLLFILIKSKSDYIYVLALYGLANVVSGIYSIYVAIKKYRLQLFLPSVADILGQLKYSWFFFVSNFSITVSNSINTLILGFFVSVIDIGYYSIVEKIIFVIWLILGLFSQAIYPTVCRLSQESFQQVYQFVYRIILPFIITIALICLFIYVYSYDILLLITGHYEAKMTNLLRLMSVIPFIVALNVPAYQILLAYDFKKEYAVLFNSSAIANLILCTLLVYIWGVVGAAVCMIFIQAFITIALYVVMFTKLKQLMKFSNFQPLNRY